MKINDSKFFGIMLVLFGSYTLYKGEMNFYFGLIKDLGVLQVVVVYIMIILGTFLILRK